MDTPSFLGGRGGFLMFPAFKLKLAGLLPGLFATQVQVTE